MGEFLFDFYWPHHRICHHYGNIWRVILMILNQHSSRSSKVIAPNCKPICGFVYDLHCVPYCISHDFRDIWCKVLWPRSRMVLQGHPKSKIMVPIDSPGMVSYSTSIDPIVISVTIFEIFDIKAFFHRSSGENWFQFWLAEMRLDFRISTENNRWPHLPGLYLGGKFGEDRWRIAICRAFNSFRVTDWLTHTDKLIL